jgi:hypothetical protein
VEVKRAERRVAQQGGTPTAGRCGAGFSLRGALAPLLQSTNKIPGAKAPLQAHLCPHLFPTAYNGGFAGLGHIVVPSACRLTRGPG